MINLYILPVIHLTSPNYNVPAYLWHRFHDGLPELQGVRWAWTTFLLDDVAMLICDVTAEQDIVLQAQPNVWKVPPLDETISTPPTRNAIRNRLEAYQVAGTWVETGMSYRTVLRRVNGIFDFHNRWVGRVGVRIFDTTRNTLNSLVQNMNEAEQAVYPVIAAEIGMDISNITGSSTLRDLFTLAGAFTASTPFSIDGAGMSMVI